MKTRHTKEADPPSGLEKHPPGWHLDKLIEFTHLKKLVGEPSPHLAIVGHMTKGWPSHRRAWAIGCYGAVYCLPTAQVLWTQWPDALSILKTGKPDLILWLGEHWPGIVTRQERRCIRTPTKLARCLIGYADWVVRDLPILPSRKTVYVPNDYYDYVWESVTSVPFIGRYIAIRIIEGLKRYCGVPAQLYDMRSIGGWSPKKALVYIYPEHMDTLLRANKKGDALADTLTAELLSTMQASLPWLDYYVLAAMLCEYKGAFENRTQYPGWTIDQEPLMYDKVKAYWGADFDESLLWGARTALFPPEALGEIGGWHGTRWPLAKTLRDFGYNWSDTKFNYVETLKTESWENPVEW